MREDQYRRLVALQEKLIDVALDEADPDRWPGAGVEPAAMDKSTRGDRYWCKKSAAATIMLEARIAARIGTEQALARAGLPPPAAADAPPAEDDLDDEIGRFEKEAAKQLAKFRARAVGKP